MSLHVVDDLIALDLDQNAVFTDNRESFRNTDVLMENLPSLSSYVDNHRPYGCQHSYSKTRRRWGGGGAIDDEWHFSELNE